MILGKHVSIAGGIDKAPGRAKELGCNALQIFAKNPRSWRGRKIGEDEAEKVKQACNELDMKPLVVHDTYLINLASSDRELREKSIRGLKDELSRAGLIGASFLVVHPGSHGGRGEKEGIELISKAINELLSEIKNDTIILLENVAGSGNTIGSKFIELNDIIKKVEEKDRIGICVDTCHAYAAGYDLRHKDGLEKMLDELDKELGIDYLKLIHINDSKHPLASKKDEHAHIGEGFIGCDGFSLIINHTLLRDLPFILETPQFKGEDKDVEKLLSLRND